MQKIENLMQFLKFCFVGASNTIIALAVYYALWYSEVNYLLANTLAFVISVLNAFYWNNKYVFVNENLYWILVLGKTYLSYGFSFIVGTILLYIFVEFVGLSEKVAPILILLFTIPLNFLLNKFWTFR